MAGKGDPVPGATNEKLTEPEPLEVSLRKGSKGDGPPSVLMIPARAQVIEGLECLVQLDRVYIKPQTELLEIFTDWKTTERYDVLTVYGQRVFFAAEYSGSGCIRCFCSGRKPFEVNLLDMEGRACLTFKRACSCSLICFPFCCGGNKVDVTHSMSGDHLGAVVQVCSGCTPTLNILSPTGDVILVLVGHRAGLCCNCCRSKATFNIFLPDKVTPVGEVMRHEESADYDGDGGNGGEPTEMDSFGPVFPSDLDLAVKASLIAASFLIDYEYFSHERGLHYPVTDEVVPTESTKDREMLQK